jgi:hypothetical protein
MKKIIIILFILLIIGIIVTYLYVFKDHRNIAAEEVSYTIEAVNLFSEFQSDEISANSRYLDKTIEVKGAISSIDSEAKSIVVDGKLFATFKDKIPESFHPNSKIKIKGRFIGYDALLEELKMDQCVLETP